MDENRQSIRTQLQPGEVLLWEGAPERGIHFQRSDLLAIPFSLLWCGFAIFWEIGVIATGGPLLFKIWGIPFVLMGLYITVGRFFFRAWQLAGTCYAVTDRRVILQSRRETVFLPYGQIPLLQKEVRANGTGTIWFRPPTSCGAGKHRHRVPGVGFEEIADAEKVYRIIEGQMLHS